MKVILPYLEGKKNRKGRCLVFCGMDIVPNLSVFRHDYGVILFLSWFITVTERFCVMLMFYEIVLCSMTYLWVLGQFLEIPHPIISVRSAASYQGPFFFLTYLWSCNKVTSWNEGLVKWLSLCEPQFPHFQNRDFNSYTGLLRGFDEILYI